MAAGSDVWLDRPDLAGAIPFLIAIHRSRSEPRAGFRRAPEQPDRPAARPNCSEPCSQPGMARHGAQHCVARPRRRRPGARPQAAHYADDATEAGAAALDALSASRCARRRCRCAQRTPQNIVPRYRSARDPAHSRHEACRIFAKIPRLTLCNARHDSEHTAHRCPVNATPQ